MQQEVVKQNCISNPFKFGLCVHCTAQQLLHSVQNHLDRFTQSANQIFSNKTGMCREQEKELEGVSNQ